MCLKFVDFFISVWSEYECFHKIQILLDEPLNVWNKTESNEIFLNLFCMSKEKWNVDI